jgi:glutathione S-transferase
VPTFIDEDGTAVNESLAAVLYLDRRYPDAGCGPLVPADPAAAGAVLQRTLEAGVLHAAISAVIYPKMRGELTSDESMSAWKDKAAALKTELGHWDAYAAGSGGDWITGPAFTAADVAAAPFVLALRRFGASLADFPALAAYADRLAARPSIADTWPPHWKEGDGPGWLKDAGL